MVKGFSNLSLYGKGLPWFYQLSMVLPILIQQQGKGFGVFSTTVPTNAMLARSLLNDILYTIQYAAGNYSNNVTIATK